HIKILIQACRIWMRAKLIVILALVSQPQEVLKVHYMLALIVGQLVKRTIPAQYHAKFDIWHYRLREFLPNCIELFLEQKDFILRNRYWRAITFVAVLVPLAAMAGDYAIPVLQLDNDDV